MQTAQPGVLPRFVRLKLASIGLVVGGWGQSALASQTAACLYTPPGKVELAASPNPAVLGQTVTLHLNALPCTGYVARACTIEGRTLDTYYNLTLKPGDTKYPTKATTKTYSGACQWYRGTTAVGGYPGTVNVRFDPPPTVSLTPAKPLFVAGESSTTTLTWTTTKVGSCTASGAWSGSKNPAGGSEAVPAPSTTSTYKLTCSGYGLSVPSSSTIQVFGPPQNLGSVVNRAGDELSVSLNRASSDTMLILGYAPSGGTGDLYQATYLPSVDRWSSPSALPAPVNSAGFEHTASNQGAQIVIAGWRTQPATNFDLFQSLWTGSAFTEPVKLSFSTSSNEGSPFIATDGSKMVFASDRPGGAGSYDLYEATPTATIPWGSVTRIGAPISSSAMDISPSLNVDSSILLFSSTRGGNFDLYYSLKQGSGWGAPIAFGAPLNTGDAEQSPVLTPDGTRLYFVSNRPGGYGGLDIYVSVRK